MHAITRRTPSEVMLGYEIRRGGIDIAAGAIKEELLYDEYISNRSEMREVVASNLTREQERMSHSYNLRQRPYPQYNVGDYVMIQPTVVDVVGSAKISKKFFGPYIVKEKLDLDRYVIIDIPGYLIKQKIYESILSSERFKPWVSVEDPANNCYDECHGDVKGELRYDEYHGDVEGELGTQRENLLREATNFPNTSL